MGARLRLDATDSATGRLDPSLSVGPEGRVFMYSSGNERACETDPNWPPVITVTLPDGSTVNQVNTGFGTEILATIYTDATIEDYFTNTSSRPAFTPLNGTTTEVGDRLWSANTSLVIDQSQVTNQGVTGALGAGFPFTGSDRPAETIWEVEAEVDFTGSEWVGLGFSTAAQGLIGNGAVWMVLNQSGIWRVWANGTSTSVGTGPTTDLLEPGFNRLVLRYDSVSSQVQASINDEIVLGFTATPALSPITHVSFQFQDPNGAQVGSTLLDRLKVRTLTEEIFSSDFESGNLLGWSIAVGSVP